ncbi:helix-turn-helix domain-containing protein [Paraburkholderia caribensis]|nr:helix-turn-helix transcriptional regulator [Paraburkholderia caribensis]
MNRSETLDTQVKVAARAGIAQSTVGRLLRGEVYAQLSQVEALAEAFRVNVASLLSEHENDAPASSSVSNEGYASLTDEERQQVSDFIAFLAARHQPAASPTALNIEASRESASGLKERLVQAIQREFNDDTLNINHEREPETKHTRQSRKRTSSQ